MSEAIAFFGGLIAMMIVWFVTDGSTHSPYLGGKRMKIGDEVAVHGYIDEIRKDVVIIRNDGGYFGTVRKEIVVVWPHKEDQEERA